MDILLELSLISQKMDVETEHYGESIILDVIMERLSFTDQTKLKQETSLKFNKATKFDLYTNNFYDLSFS